MSMPSLVCAIVHPIYKVSVVNGPFHSVLWLVTKYVPRLPSVFNERKQAFWLIPSAAAVGVMQPTTGPHINTLFSK
jgi:hypothetical protein